MVHSESPLAKQMAASAERLCFTFPNRFAYVDTKRGLAAGFHLVEGFFRDDRPLVEKVLDDQQNEELNRLWEELDFVTRHSETLLRGFVWFERSERHVLHDQRFDFLRPEDPQLINAAMLNRFEKVYLEKMGIKLVEGSLKPVSPSEKYDMIHGFFEQVREGLTCRQELLQKAEELAWRDMKQIAEQAFRRPLSDRDKQSLNALYRAFRDQGQDIETSLRGVMTAVLMSPRFCYRYTEVASGSDVVPLSDYALASRLSYFLWSTLPDEELLAAATSGKLQDESVLLAHTRRMLKDRKVESFAREFFGQWLRYRDYLANDSVNGEAFPGYTDELRQAMFEEPVRLATHLIEQDKPITEWLRSDFTFVNGVLAKHYGGD
ncbi:MAG: DUF1592 domain-containing protein, partial [Planctomycetaceae bacterium]|nr:DUF1592 domain-containing protein [Planctomycetaceae bacterium]